MRPPRVILLTKPKWLPPLLPTVKSYEQTTLDDPQGAVLIAFSTGVIVPADVLGQVERAYNFHPASPQFPGRDPHHWAIYEDATEYGATAHVMTEKVDEGPIVGLRTFKVEKGASPRMLMDLAHEAAYRLFLETAPKMLTAEVPEISARWCGTKRTRKDLLDMCRLTPDLSPEEIGRRRKAFAGFELSFDSSDF